MQNSIYIYNMINTEINDFINTTFYYFEQRK